MKITKENRDAILKLLVIGDAHVGKSCLLRRYVDDTFSESYLATLGVEFKTRTLQKTPMSGRELQLQVWDTVGIERFRTIVSSYYRGAHGVVLVFDVTDQKSFDALTTRMNEIRMYASENAQVLLIANKIDLADKRVVGSEDVRLRADRLDVPFIETSAKDGSNVKTAFDTFAKQIMETRLAC